jgi:urate oxidase
MSSSPIVRTQSYGKSQVRLSRITRQAERHKFIELTCWIELEGDFEAAYTRGDNSLVVATDTMKNTVYALAQRHGVTSIEAFAQLLGRHFLDSYGHVRRVQIRSEEASWSRLTFDGREHAHAFLGGGSERNVCRLVAGRDDASLHCGLNGLTLLKTTGSGFAGFWRDEYTILPETADRVFATSLQAEWPCRDLTADWSAARQLIRAAFIDVFANQYSKSVQQTLYEMARAALAACPLVDEIKISMPNQHHIPVDLRPLGLANANEVFVPTSEPFGRISATVARSDARQTSD